MEFRLYDIETAYAGMLLWDQEHAEKVLRAWAAWTVDAPDCVTTSFRMLNLPPMPELPPFLRGRQLVVIDGAVLAEDERAAEILAALRALEPEMDTFARVPAAGLVRLHMDPEGPTPAVSASRDPRRPARRGDRDVPGPDRPGLGLDAARGRAPSARRCAGPARPRAPARCRGSTVRSCMFAVAIAATPGDGGAGTGRRARHWWTR